MNLFHIIDDAVVHLLSRGVYREAKCYRRGEQVFAKWGSGFVRLLGGGGTTLSAVSWQEIEGPGITLKPIGKVPLFTEPSE